MKWQSPLPKRRSQASAFLGLLKAGGIANAWRYLMDDDLIVERAHDVV